MPVIAGGGEHFFATQLTISCERDRHDTEAGGVGGLVARISYRLADDRQMTAFDHTVDAARQNETRAHGQGHPAPHPSFEQATTSDRASAPQPRRLSAPARIGAARAAACRPTGERRRGIPFSD